MFATHRNVCVRVRGSINISDCSIERKSMRCVRVGTYVNICGGACVCGKQYTCF